MKTLLLLALVGLLILFLVDSLRMTGSGGGLGLADMVSAMGRAVAGAYGVAGGGR